MLEFTEKLSVGIPSIDKQHATLVGIVNSLFEQYENNADHTASAKALVKLQIYVANHFKHEEELFEKYNWPQINEHKSAHAILVEKIKDIESDLSQENDEKNSLRLMNLLKEWLSQHILVEDKAYAEFLQSKGVK